jgi:hypothetical protein
MNTFIKTTLKTLAITALFMSGAAFADAASFDPEPIGNDGFNTINTDCSSDCANDYNTVSYDNVVNNGSGEFTVYLNFRNASSGDLTGANASVSVPSSGTSSSVTINGQLNGNFVDSIDDVSYVNNLPDSWEIEFVDGFVRVEEHTSTTGQTCSELFPGTWPWQFNFSNPGFTTIGTLHDWGDGWCDQGYVFATFRVIDTTVASVDLIVDTLEQDNVTTDSALLKGYLGSGENATVGFALSTSSNPSCSNPSHTNGNNISGTHDTGFSFSKTKNGLTPNTRYYYKACAEASGEPDASGDRFDFYTLASIPVVEVTTLGDDNITTNSATINGRLVSGENVDMFFRYSTSSNVNCTSSSYSYAGGPNNLDGPNNNFDADISGLNSDTRYYYIACGDLSGDITSGNVELFDTDDVTTTYTYQWQPGNWGSCVNNMQTLDYECHRFPGNDIVSDNACFINIPGPKPLETRECGITTDDLYIYTAQATNLSDNTATINGDVLAGETTYVYFVWKEENSSLTCSGDTETFPSDWSIPRGPGDDFEYVFSGSQLTPDRTYYYKACARDENNQIISGDREEFTTDDNGGGGDDRPDANTDSPRDVDEDSAKLRGYIDMNDFNNGIVFFVYGQDEDEIRDTEDDHDSYDEARDDEDNDEFEVEFVRNNFDSSDDFDERITSLEEDERYYYQMCVEYEESNGDERLECGGVEDFYTDNDNSGNNNNNDTEIETQSPRNVTQSTAEMCADLVDDGGGSVQTWIEFRTSNQSSYNNTPIRQRNEVSFCERVTGLSPNTSYLYRACTPDDCDTTRTFRTLGTNIPSGQTPIIITDNITNIRTNSAVLNGTYVTNTSSGTCRFDYGRTSSLGRSTRTYNVTGFGACVHSFTNLAVNTQYCVQAVIETAYGTDKGSVRCFNTPPTTGGPTLPSVVVVADATEIDPLSLGLGISLVRLDINDEEEVVVRGENVEYTITWENVSEIDLDDLNLKVVMPPEIQVIDISRGRFDQDQNTIYFTIDELDGIDFENNRPGEDGSLMVRGIVERGTVGNLVTAEAELSYDNPINKARENATDWDINEYGIQVAGVTASVFGLANITFLGWLVILLGLFIIFLVARWLYLEREEMRAQAYAGYVPAPQYLGAPQNNGYAQTQAPMYIEPEAPYVPPTPQTAPQNDGYAPYRPNRD